MKETVAQVVVFKEVRETPKNRFSQMLNRLSLKPIWRAKDGQS
jgi:hypothetical protein